MSSTNIAAPEPQNTTPPEDCKMGWREQIYRIIDNDEESTPQSQAFEIFITILILMSIASIILESFDYLQAHFSYYFDLFENITLGIFSVEYLVRLLTADFKYKSKNYFKSLIRFITSGSGIIDFIAISPLMFKLYNLDFRFLRALKISRLLRVLKLSSLTNSVIIIGEVFVEKRSELGMTLFVAFVLLLISSTLMWYIEGDVQPDKFSNIVTSFWWAIATLTTVGYGDVFPLTAWGKFLSGCIAVLGIGIVALPAGILSSAFIGKLEEEADKRKAREAEERAEKEAAEISAHQVVHGSACTDQFGKPFVFCPYCGERITTDHGH